MCSPTFGIKTLADLRRAALIHIDFRRRPLPLPDWEHWCRQVGARDIDTTAGQHLPDSLLAVQAAIAGQGVAIESLVLVSDALRAGLLVAPFSTSLPGDSYHFVCADGLQKRDDITSLRDWFVRELAPNKIAALTTSTSAMDTMLVMKAGTTPSTRSAQVRQPRKRL